MTKNILILNSIFYLIVSFLIWKNKILIIPKHILNVFFRIYGFSILLIYLSTDTTNLEKNILAISLLTLHVSILGLKQTFSDGLILSKLSRKNNPFTNSNYYLILNTNKDEISKILKTKNEIANVKPLFLNQILFKFNNNYDLDANKLYSAYNEITIKSNFSFYLYLFICLCFVSLYFIF